PPPVRFRLPHSQLYHNFLRQAILGILFKFALNPNDIRFDFTCDVGGYRYENYFDKNDKKYYLKIY
ncbi:hypothetical protein, partial [Treponema socranskii]|uniref:hypothetical protein n=1 Tax=Treponema socranskii TaxID=53419 RepID=UPI0005713835